MKATLSALGAALAAATLLAGCETTQLAEPSKTVPVETRTPLAAGGSGTGAGARSSGTPQSNVTTVDLSKAAAGGGAAGAGTTAAMSLPSQRIVYFDFDSFVIKDDYKPVLDAYGRALTAQRSKHVVVEGHTDERGGREYNLALGQKRAEAVVKSLKLLGATDAQLEAVSFGKERPAATGNDEAAWAQNRRAELKDR